MEGPVMTVKKVWSQHIKELEAEFKKTQCPALREHIQRLKKAWGFHPPGLVAA
jgi:hypothetical protein